MMSLTFGLFTQVSGLGPLGPLVFCNFSQQLKDILILHKMPRNIHVIVLENNHAICKSYNGILKNSHFQM